MMIYLHKFSQFIILFAYFNDFFEWGDLKLYQIDASLFD